MSVNSESVLSRSEQLRAHLGVIGKHIGKIARQFRALAWSLPGLWRAIFKR
jgi:hypothetical protein